MNKARTVKQFTCGNCKIVFPHVMHVCPKCGWGASTVKGMEPAAEHPEDTIIIDGGHVFHGSRKQFSENFFTNATDNIIRDWAGSVSWKKEPWTCVIEHLNDPLPMGENETDYVNIRGQFFDTRKVCSHWLGKKATNKAISTWCANHGHAYRILSQKAYEVHATKKQFLRALQDQWATEWTCMAAEDINTLHKLIKDSKEE